MRKMLTCVERTITVIQRTFNLRNPERQVPEAKIRLRQINASNKIAASRDLSLLVRPHSSRGVV